MRGRKGRVEIFEATARYKKKIKSTSRYALYLLCCNDKCKDERLIKKYEKSCMDVGVLCQKTL